MNSIKILIVVFLLTNHLLTFGQWIEQISNTSNNLNQVQFVSENTGYIVGDFGTILKTENSGELWFGLNVQSSENITSLQFVNENIGFVGTLQGSVFKTIDGGNSWSQLDVETENNIELHFIDPLIGFIGTKNNIYKTTNGGQSWIKTDVSTVENIITIYEIECKQNDCYALNKEGILKSTNQGDSWEQILNGNHPDYNPANILESIEIIDDNIIYTGSPYYQGLYKTEDDFSNISFSQIIINDIEFLNRDIGYSIQEHGRIISKTSNGAENWSFEYTIQDNGLRLNDLYFFDSELGWAVGNDGKILKTQNGGISTSIEESKIEHDLVIYPNPTKDILIIPLISTNVKLNSEVELFSLNGESVKTFTIDKETNSINLEFLNSGSYILKYKIEERTYNRLIVKE